jgi:hypothetical protein
LWAEGEGGLDGPSASRSARAAAAVHRTLHRTHISLSPSTPTAHAIKSFLAIRAWVGVSSAGNHVQPAPVDSPISNPSDVIANNIWRG